MHQNSKLTRENLYRALVKEGRSTVTAATVLGATPSGVNSAAKRFGIPVRPRKDAAIHRWNPLSDEKWIQVGKRMHENNLTMEELEKEIGRCPATISKNLHRLRIKVRPRGAEVRPNSRSRIPFDEKRFKHLNLIEGKTLPEIEAILPEHPSVQVLCRRAKARGWAVKNNKAGRGRSEHPNYQIKKRLVAEQLGPKICRICGEERAVDISHIQPRKAPHHGPLVKENCMWLCKNHNWNFDRGLLTKEEVRKIRSKLIEAKKHGYESVHYKV